MTSRNNGNGTNPSDDAGTDELTQSELTRPSPDAILADEADPDTLLGIESDSEAGGSRPASMLLNTGGKRTSKRVSKQLHDISLDPFSSTKSTTKEEEDGETPKKSNFINSKGDNHQTSVLEQAPLKDQVTELSTQVTGLNNKLVTSFMRIGDLEDNVSEMEETIANYRKQIETLEKERQEHLAALNTGLLVEKEHVSNEMQKMMERLVQETAEKGKAVDERQKIESELDELSSSLFSEANKMVAVERLARARAEEKSKSMEERLKDTEEIVGQQQKRLVELQASVERNESKTSTSSSHTQSEFKDGQDRSFLSTGLLSKTNTNESLLLPVQSKSGSLRLDIVPYVELRAFLNHLRRLRLQLAPFYNYPVQDNAHISEDISHGTPLASRTGSPAPSQLSTPGPTTSQNAYFQPSPFLAAGVTRHRDFPTLPANVEQLVHIPNQISTLAFLKRLNDEDCEPCLGLDYAPGLNWLSKRQMRTAILDGSFMIEPIFGGGIYDEESVRMKAIGAPPAACALCGKAVVNVPLPGGGSSSDASSWMSAASSLQASVNAMANSLPVRELAASPPPTLQGSTAGGVTTPKEITRSKSSIFSTLRNISGGRSSTPDKPVANSTTADVTASTTSQPVGVVEDLFALRPPAIPTHIFRISEASTTRYLLCPDFCLSRVRATCDFWGYVRNLERAVVLEGKFAWDDEANAEDETAPRLPTKDINMDKGGLKEEDKEDSQAVAEKAEKENGDVAEEEEKEEKEKAEEEEEEEDDVAGGDESAQSNPKGTSSLAVSDVEDDHDFADAMSQHSSDDDGEVKEDEEKALQPAIEIEEKNEKEEKSDDTKGDDEEVAEKGEEPLSTPVPSPLPKSANLDAPPPLPKSARPVPKLPNSTAPPALPPRRVRTPANANSTSTPNSPQVIVLGPEPKRLLPLKNSEKPVWEEKVWIEVNRLRADMWSARVGIKSDQE